MGLVILERIMFKQMQTDDYWPSCVLPVVLLHTIQQWIENHEQNSWAAVHQCIDVCAGILCEADLGLVCSVAKLIRANLL